MLYEIRITADDSRYWTRRCVECATARGLSRAVAATYRRMDRRLSARGIEIWGGTVDVWGPDGVRVRRPERCGYSMADQRDAYED
jgi:hypothetical protein